MADRGASGAVAAASPGWGLFGRAYVRLGPRYPVAALGFALLSLYVAFLASLAVLPLYLEMSGREFALLALAVVVQQTFYSLVVGRALLRALRPLATWLGGDRDSATAVAAWRAAGTLPLEYLRLLRRYLLFLWGAIAFCGVTALVLEFDPLTALILLAPVAVSILYSAALFFFVTERAMRPVMADLARELPDRDAPTAPGVPLRWRLLATIPAINIATSLVVAGLSSPGASGLEDLGVVVLVAVAVSSTGPLVLALLLSDSVVSPIAELRTATQRLSEGDLSARAALRSTDETGALARSFNEMAAGLEERERLREAFGAYVDPHLAERVLRQGTDTAGEEVEVSVLFVDVRGFTTWAEHRTAREAVARLNALYDCVVPVIEQHGGHANKFVGDGLLAVFGAPDRLEDHADRAVAAALDVARLVSERFGGELRVGIGVNSGPVMAGTIGGGGRLDFTVIGDTVNTAARVEAATRDTGDDVLVTAATRDGLAHPAGGWEERPPIPLKGKRDPVRLYAPGDRR